MSGQFCALQSCGARQQSLQTIVGDWCPPQLGEFATTFHKGDCDAFFKSWGLVCTADQQIQNCQLLAAQFVHGAAVGFAKPSKHKSIQPDDTFLQFLNMSDPLPMIAPNKASARLMHNANCLGERESPTFFVESKRQECAQTGQPTSNDRPSLSPLAS